MKRLFVPALLCLGLFACRALVGIDDLEFQPQGQGPNNNGTSGGNGGGDTPPTTCLDAGADCPKCCKDTFKEFRDTFEHSQEAANCLCGDAGCGAACLTTLCAPTGPTDLPPERDCAQCTDPIISAPPPNACASACKTRECNAGLECMQLCAGKKP